MKKYHKILLTLTTFIILPMAIMMSSCNGDDDDNPPVSPYDQADAINGGKLFDKFWADETGFDKTNPNYNNINAYPNFFRCKQCHGWDLLGNTGAYNNRKPKTSRPNVSSVSLIEVRTNDTPQQIFDEIKAGANTRDLSYDLSTYDPATNATEGDKMPNFGALFTDAQIWDIVKFIKEGAFDVTQLYDLTTTGTYPDGTHTFTNIGKDGVAATGDVFFTNNCASCHGTLGNGPASGGDEIIIDDGDTLTVGFFGRNKPYELQHKIKFGNLGSEMVGVPTATVSDVKNLFKALQDTAKYPD